MDHSQRFDSANPVWFIFFFFFFFSVAVVQADFLVIYIYLGINFKQESGVFHGNPPVNLIYAFQLC